MATKSRATLKDVARLAGVSTATVARVIHNQGYVSAEARVAVEAAIEATGYRINAVAQGLRRQRSLVIGHVLRAIAPNPFFANVALGVDEEAARFGCGVLTTNTQEDSQMERDAVETLLRRQVDAILFTSVRDLHNLELAAEAGIPVIQVERVSIPTLPGVLADNYQGTVAAIDHLASLGHRRIAFIGEASETRDDGYSRQVERDRLAGYRDGLKRHDLPVDEALIDIDGAYFDADHARLVARRLIAMDDRPTAIFAACDHLACAVLQELYALDIRVPDQMSVIGFDDTIAANLSPPLTTVAQPAVELGQTAVRMALDLLNRSSNGASDERFPLQPCLQTQLVVRESTGPAPKLGTGP
jgi:DNA-binding LacI/PurR family transcriptional regulator